MATKANIGARISLDGEKEYRQAVGNISKSMNVLKSDLKAVSSEYANNANSLEALTAKNSILTKQQSEQEKKLQLLRGVLDDVTKEYGENSKKAQEWQIKLNNAYAELNKINSELDDNKKYMKEAKTSTDKTAKSIDEFGKEVKGAKEETLTFGDILKANLSSQAIVAGIKALGSALKEVASSTVELVQSTATYADDILTMATQTGIATDTLQELKYMAELTDTSLETITASMAKNIRSMASAQDGTDKYVEAYRKLGIEITDTNGQLKDSETVFWSSIDALGNMANETERDALAMQLFGKSAQDLNPLIELGKDKVAGFAKEAQNMGAVLSNETLVSLGETDDALQRMYQQFEITKREFGQAMAPAMTEAFGKLTDKIGEVDDKFANLAGGALEDTVDAFIWMIDNSDKIGAGLKGIGAAIITKKAADGVIAAMNAYKTLTVTTEAATVAQTAFNTASKANVIGAIASVVIGLGTALYSYAKSAKDAEEETRKLNDESYQLLETHRKLSEEVDENTKKRKEETSSIKAESGAVKILTDSLYDLAEKEGKTSEEKQQMISLVEELNNAIPDLSLAIDEQTGALSLQRNEIDKLIESQLQLNMVQAAQESLQQIAADKYNKEQYLNDLLEDRVDLQQKLTEEEEQYYKNKNRSQPVAGYNLAAFIDAKGQLMAAENAFNDNEKAIKKVRQEITGLGQDYEEAMNYIGDHSSIDGATTALDGFLTKYQTSLEGQNDEYADLLDDRVDAITDSFKASEKALDKSQKAEKKVLEKAHKEQLEAVEESANEELKILEEAHNKKLGLIDEEYLEKIKLVDEDRYKELKAVQDQIDAIDTKAEAEDRARKLKEEAEKRAELTLKVSTAKTIDEKMEAQQNLADFEKEVSEGQREAEKKLQKDILENKKDTINDTYNEKVKSLEKEQKAEKEKADEVYKTEQDAISERTELKKQELADLQELENEALADRQTAAKEDIDEQNKYALEKAQETYDADLAKFKLNNALKYDEAVANQDKINQYIIDQNNITTGGLKGTFDALKKDVYNADYKTGGGLNTKTNAFATPVIDYSKIEDAVEKGFNASLKKTPMSIKFNKKELAKVVSGEIEAMLQ